MVVVGVRGEFEASREDAEMKKKNIQKRRGRVFWVRERRETQNNEDTT